MRRRRIEARPPAPLLAGAQRQAVPMPALVRVCEGGGLRVGAQPGVLRLGRRRRGRVILRVLRLLAVAPGAADAQHADGPGRGLRRRRAALRDAGGSQRGGRGRQSETTRSGAGDAGGGEVRGGECRRRVSMLWGVWAGAGMSSVDASVRRRKRDSQAKGRKTRKRTVRARIAHTPSCGGRTPPGWRPRPGARSPRCRAAGPTPPPRPRAAPRPRRAASLRNTTGASASKPGLAQAGPPRSKEEAFLRGAAEVVQRPR